jgi:hypothetical protein
MAVDVAIFVGRLPTKQICGKENSSEKRKFFENANNESFCYLYPSQWSPFLFKYFLGPSSFTFLPPRKSVRSRESILINFYYPRF